VVEEVLKLTELTNGITEFTNWGFTQKIQFFAWYVQSVEAKGVFRVADVRRCFDALSLVPPTNPSDLVNGLARQKRLIRRGDGFALEKSQFDKLESQYGTRPGTIAVEKLLSELPSKLKDVDEQGYLQEAIACFRVKAFRAAVLMAWNVTYNHLRKYIVQDPSRLATFNAELAVKFKGERPISVIEDFDKLKESQVLEVCKIKNCVYTSNVAKIMESGLTRRNLAAHATGTMVTPAIAEALIQDLIENALLKL